MSYFFLFQNHVKFTETLDEVYSLRTVLVSVGHIEAADNIICRGSVLVSWGFIKRLVLILKVMNILEKQIGLGIYGIISSVHADDDAAYK